MAGALRKTMLYLGLADDSPTADGYVAPQLVEPMLAPVGEVVAQAVAPVIEHSAEVTPIRPLDPQLEDAPAPVGELRRITTIHPRSYNDARLVGESFREGIPVIMNLTDLPDADARRLVDFSSGLIFGLHGGIERVTAKVFLLSPEHVEVLNEEDVTRTPDSGSFYNQL